MTPKPFVQPSDLPGYEKGLNPIEQETHADAIPATKWDWETALKSRSRESGIVGGVQHVALLLSTYADGDGSSIRPTIATLQQVSGRSRSTVQAALKTLRETGWIQQVSRGSGVERQASEYRLSVPTQP